jgi:Protein of unknown function (DUF2778)
MTVRTAWADHSPAYDDDAYDDDSAPIVSAGFPRQALSLPNALPQQILGAAALTCVALTCAWGICANLGGGSADTGDAMRSDRLVFAADRGDRLEADELRGPASAGIASANINVSTAFDDRFSAAFPPGVSLGDGSTQSVAYDPALPTPNGGQVAALTPPPAPLSLSPRLRRHGRLQLPETQQPTETVASAPPEEPSLFERIFGRRSSSIFAKLYGPPPSKVTLAYADVGTVGDGTNVTTGLYDRQTAVYDISAHVVYLPDGTELEAHSGYGDRLDDPNSAAVRDLGVTPPDVYDLQPREAIFHGVHALRLVPEDESKVFGRAGLLAHTYMLGPNGQSNGCVSFKDYDTFLQAYENHEITRIAVVSHID